MVQVISAVVVAVWFYRCARVIGKSGLGWAIIGFFALLAPTIPMAILTVGIFRKAMLLAALRNSQVNEPGAIISALVIDLVSVGLGLIVVFWIHDKNLKRDAQQSATPDVDRLCRRSLSPETGMQKWVQVLRFGASLCLLSAVFIVAVGLPCYYRRGDYTVQRKYQQGAQLRIHAVGPGGIDAPYSHWFYAKAHPGDEMHFGFHYITLRHSGNLVAIDVPLDTRRDILWFLLAIFPSLAFIPPRRLPVTSICLALVTLAEVITIGGVLARLCMRA